MFIFYIKKKSKLSTYSILFIGASEGTLSRRQQFRQLSYCSRLNLYIRQMLLLDALCSIPSLPCSLGIIYNEIYNATVNYLCYHEGCVNFPQQPRQGDQLSVLRMAKIRLKYIVILNASLGFPPSTPCCTMNVESS